MSCVARAVLDGPPRRAQDKLAAIEPIKYPLKHAARMKKIQVGCARMCVTRLIGAVGGRCIGTVGMAHPGTLFHRRQRGIPMHSYENMSQIRALQVELCELRAVENAPKGTFQSLETMQRLGGIPRLEAEVAELAEDAAEWFGGENAGRLRELATGREKQIGSSGGSLEPPGPLLEPPGHLLTHLHTVSMAYSECLPTRLNPMAEGTCFSQATGLTASGKALFSMADKKARRRPPPPAPPRAIGPPPRAKPQPRAGRAEEKEIDALVRGCVVVTIKCSSVHIVIQLQDHQPRGGFDASASR
jgi:hypothetical protein